MKTCDSLDKATVQVIQAAEALRFRLSLEKLEKDIVEVIDELDDGIKREILAKFNEKRAFHTADSLLK
jgi:hypothetical protein